MNRNNYSWPFSGGGMDGLGVKGKPLLNTIRRIKPDELLVRVDALGLCASDAKMIRMGRNHPLLSDIDFSRQTLQLGHEAALTVVEVGRDLRDKFHIDQRFALHPDLMIKGKRLILGVQIEGAMTQYLILDGRVIVADDGCHIVEVPPDFSDADTAMMEPYACVEASYENALRSNPVRGGLLLIKGQPKLKKKSYYCSLPLDQTKVFLIDPPSSILEQFDKQGTKYVICKNESIGNIIHTHTHDRGFDDIIAIEEDNPQVIESLVASMSDQGVFSLVSDQPFSSLILVDVGRIHYHGLKFTGVRGEDITAGYTQSSHRYEIQPRGNLLIAGAGGALGRMHLQRALGMKPPPKTILAVGKGRERLRSIMDTFSQLAEKNKVKLVPLSTTHNFNELKQLIDKTTNGRGCDDIIIVAPEVALIGQMSSFLASDGVLNIFSGVPIGSRVNLPLTNVFFNRATITGSSGSKVEHFKMVLKKICEGQIKPSKNIAAIGGLNAVPDGLRALIDKTYAGKIIIFPHLLNLPLMSMKEVRKNFPQVASEFDPDGSWSHAAEVALKKHFISFTKES